MLCLNLHCPTIRTPLYLPPPVTCPHIQPLYLHPRDPSAPPQYHNFTASYYHHVASHPSVRPFRTYIKIIMAMLVASHVICLYPVYVAIASICLVPLSSMSVVVTSIYSSVRLLFVYSNHLSIYPSYVSGIAIEGYDVCGKIER